MKLNKLLRQARNTRLRRLSESNKTDEILIDYINLAVLDLYKRFQLKTNEAIITLQSGVTEYSLDGTDPNVSLPDTSEVLQITSAFDTSGEIPINADENRLGIYTISYNKVQIPITETGEHISIIYRPYPEDIEYVDDGTGKAVDVDVDLPQGLTNCVLDYIAYLAYDSTDSNGEEYYAMYERSCTRADSYGVIPSDMMSRDTIKEGYA